MIESGPLRAYVDQLPRTRVPFSSPPASASASTHPPALSRLSSTSCASLRPDRRRHRGGASATGRRCTARLGEPSRFAGVRPTDHMRIASVAKVFDRQPCALSFVRDGVLSLDDTLGEWLPDFNPDWNGVMPSQLLQHTSGVPTLRLRDALRRLHGVAAQVPPPRAIAGIVAVNGPLPVGLAVRVLENRRPDGRGRHRPLVRLELGSRVQTARNAPPSRAASGRWCCVRSSTDDVTRR